MKVYFGLRLRLPPLVEDLSVSKCPLLPVVVVSCSIGPFPRPSDTHDALSLLLFFFVLLIFHVIPVPVQLSLSILNAVTYIKFKDR